MNKIVITVLAVITVLVAGLFLLHRLNRPDCTLTIKAHDADMNALIFALRTYKNEVGQFPTGDTAAIVSALQGQNPREEVFIRMQDREPGIIRDPWRTPYRISIGSNGITIVSAGKDCRWGTEDDLSKTKDANRVPVTD